MNTNALASVSRVLFSLINFMKNVALMGGAIRFIAMGAGAYSPDARADRTELLTTT